VSVEIYFFNIPIGHGHEFTTTLCSSFPGSPASTCKDSGSFLTDVCWDDNHLSTFFLSGVIRLRDGQVLPVEAERMKMDEFINATKVAYLNQCRSQLLPTALFDTLEFLD
jgi:hypothetical protein